MSTVCCVPGCKNGKESQPQSLQAVGEKQVTFHNFPSRRRERQRNNWIEVVRKGNPWWIIPEHALICSEHFQDDDFNGSGDSVFVKDWAVPSIFKKPAAESSQDDESSNQQLENCTFRLNPWRKDSPSGGGCWKPNVIYRPVHLEPSLSVVAYNQDCERIYTEEPICSVEIKTEELDPLQPTEVLSGGEEEDDSGANNEWQGDNPKGEKAKGVTFFDPNEVTQVFSADEGSENAKQAEASTRGESHRTETQTSAAVSAEDPRECRTCGVPQHRLVDIYGNEGKAKNLAKKINKHLPIKVSVKDNFPLTICATCVDLLEACSIIRESSRLQDQLFRKKKKKLKQMSASLVRREVLRTEDPGSPSCREEVSGDNQGETPDVEPAESSAETALVEKPASSRGKQAGKRRRSAVVLTSSQLGPEGGRPKRRRRSRNTEAFQEEDCTDLSHADLEKRLLAKIEANERVEAAEVQTLVCGECGEAFEEESLCRVHEKHHQIKNKMLRYQCNTCGEKFLTFYLLHKHKNTKHPVITIHMCEHCGKQFKRKDHLESHINYKHKPELPYMCHLCSRYYALYTDLKSHIKNHDKTTCNLCNMTFKSYEQLKTHKYTVHRVKSTDKGIIRSTKDPSYRRTNRVFDTTPATCSVCKFSFKNKRFLEHHILFKHPDAPIVPDLRIRHHEKQFTCTYCGLSYTTKGSLKHHINTHTKEKLHKCRFCDKTTYHMLALRSHEKSHKTERPFACTFCDMTFKLRFGLLQHIRTHTGEKPFKCHICGRAFAQTTDLKRHVARHNSGGPVRPPRRKVRCEGCGGSFPSTKRLEEHECRGGEEPTDFLSNVICDGRSVWHAQ